MSGPTPPALDPGACHVWWARPEDTTLELIELLDEQEQRRYGSYRKQRDRDRFLVACGLLRVALGHYLDRQPSTVPLLRTCPTCGRPHGKPRLPSTLPRIDLSVSHGGDWVAVALSHGAAVGVDVEPVPASFPVDGLVPHVLSPGELAGLEGLSETRRTAALLRYWTRKEAVVKATGKGLAVPLVSFAVTGPEDPPRIIDWPAALGRHVRMSLHDLHPGTGHLASLAVLGERVEVTELEGSSLLELHQLR